MESKLAFSLGKTFGEIEKKMKYVENFEIPEKDELIALFQSWWAIYINLVKKIMQP